MAWIEKYTTKKGRYYCLRDRLNGKKIYLRAEIPFYEQAVAELRDHEAGQIRTTGKAILQEVYNKYFNEGRHTKEPKTQEIIKNSLRDFIDKFKERLITSIQEYELNQFKSNLLSNHNVNGANIIIRNIKTLFTWADKNGYLYKNPSKEIKQYKPKKVSRFLTRTEIINLYKESNSKLKRTIFSLLYTGLRSGELLNLKPEDIGKTISIHKAKGQKAREVPITPRIRLILSSIVEKWTRAGFYSAWGKLLKKAKIGRVRPHDLRHTFASLYLQGGGTLADLAIILGHSSLEMVRIYSHFQKSYLSERMNKARFSKQNTIGQVIGQRG